MLCVNTRQHGHPNFDFKPHACSRQHIFRTPSQVAQCLMPIIARAIAEYYCLDISAERRIENQKCTRCFQCRRKRGFAHNVIATIYEQAEHDIYLSEIIMLKDVIGYFVVITRLAIGTILTLGRANWKRN